MAPEPAAYDPPYRSVVKPYGQALVELARQREDVVCLSGDLTRQCEVLAKAARTTGEEPAAAHVGKEADRRLRHRHLRALGGDAQAVIAPMR